ncbi:hypothetical protein MiTa_02029 [Microcystis aeruginosa NIES-4264]|nr:hypothetical protein MiHa_02139 [Microcystis aeruginosa NIES-2522]GCA88682.1 hypothetical protein MiTa_02029 [Microcystis aeruginosa NIES-4264]
MNQPTANYPSFRRPLTPSKPNPNRDNAAIAPGSGVLATGPVISVALIWKLLKMELLEKLAPLSLLSRATEDVAMPVGVIPGLEALQLKSPLVMVTYNQYLVPAVNVRGPVGVKV